MSKDKETTYDYAPVAKPDPNAHGRDRDASKLIVSDLGV